jgi:hypothetical protein
MLRGSPPEAAVPEIFVVDALSTAKEPNDLFPFGRADDASASEGRNADAKFVVTAEDGSP